MKKDFLILIIMLITYTATSQRSIKGYELGEKYKADDYKETTVFGSEATVGTLLLKDGRAYTIIAVFEDDEKSDVFNIKDRIETVFNVSLKKVDLVNNKYNVDRYRYEAVKDGVKYFLYVQENTTFDRFTIIMGMTDVNLDKEHNKEIENDI